MAGDASKVPLSKINPGFLHSNSTIHTWAFSAIAELIDNAYDPDVGARDLWIDKQKINGNDCLTFEDNGNGMSHSQLHRMLSFGYCEKAKFDESPHKPIGKYGNGFKSGSMRLAKDAIVFTVCKDSASVGFLSQTYLKDTESDTVRVPMIEYSLQKLQPVTDDFRTLLDLIQKYSPYSDDKEITKELENLKKSKETGTKIVLFNLKRHKNTGALELDFESDEADIKNPEPLEQDPPAEKSKTTRTTQHEAPEYISSLRSYCSILFLKPKMQIYICGVKVKTTLISESLSNAGKYTYKPQGLDKIHLTFGFVPSQSAHGADYGIMFYHRNRLIKAYEKVGYQKQPNALGVGVIGVIHNADFLKTTQNKQDFLRDSRYTSLLQSLTLKLNAYWDAVTADQTGENSSMEEPDWLWVQCDECRKWRRLLDDTKKEDLPDKWYCRMNRDEKHNRCDVTEEDESTVEPKYPKTSQNKSRKQQDKKMVLVPETSSISGQTASPNRGTDKDQLCHEEENHPREAEKVEKMASTPVFRDEWGVCEEFSEKGGLLQCPDSDVILHIPKNAVPALSTVDVKAAVSTNLRKVYTDLGLSENMVIVSPVVEYYADQNFTFAIPVTIELPHFLPPAFPKDAINVCMFHRDRQGQLRIENLENHSEKAALNMPANRIEVQTTHICGVFCVNCKTQNIPYPLQLRLYGKHVQLNQRQEVILTLFIWDGRLEIKDFRKDKLHEQDVADEYYHYLYGQRLVQPEDVSNIEVGVCLTMSQNEEKFWKMVELPDPNTFDLKNLPCHEPQAMTWRLRLMDTPREDFSCDVLVGYVNAGDRPPNFIDMPQRQSLIVTNLMVAKECPESDLTILIYGVGRLSISN